MPVVAGAVGSPASIDVSGATGRRFPTGAVAVDGRTMPFALELELFRAYDVVLVVIGIGVLAAATLPTLLSGKPLSLPIVVVGVGVLAVVLPLGLDAPDPLAHGPVVERVTELGVIVSLMGAGLTLDRPLGLRTWASTWRLLGISMPLTVAGVALLGWWIGGLVPAAAVLLGAVLSPTDPVLGRDVKVGDPESGTEHADEEGGHPAEASPEEEVRFSLTSEAGLNDGLAFPYVYAAIAMAATGASAGDWVGEWALVDVGYRVVVGVGLGFAGGRLLAPLILRLPAPNELGQAMVGLAALAAMLLVYGLTESVGAYGFLATFVCAMAIRDYERDHDYHKALHIVTEQAERLLTIGILLALGAAVGGGLLRELDAGLVVVGVLLVFVVRPLAGVIGLLGFAATGWPDRLAMSFFGIRGVGSLFYLSYALHHAPFAEAKELWALVAFVVLLSIAVHGVTASPVLTRLDARRSGDAG